MKAVEPNNFKKKNADGLPREIFKKVGQAAFLTSEQLLAILLKTGAPGCDVMELSQRLISAFGGSGYLVKADFTALKKQIEIYNKQHPSKRIVGIGEAKRMELAAAFELVRREYESRSEDIRKMDVKSPEMRYKAFKRVLSPDVKQEIFCVLLLDNKLHPITDPVAVFKGTLDGTNVHPREIFQEAVRWGAYAIMVAHNHPSGDPTPSSKDFVLTERLVECSRIMAIPLLDHIIVGSTDSKDGKGFVSMREQQAVKFM